MNLVLAESPSFKRLWSQLQSQAVFKPFYLPNNLNYYDAYFDCGYIDLSFLVEIGDTPVIALGLTVHKTIAEDDNSVAGYHWNFHQLPMLMMENSHCSSALIKGAYKRFLKQLNMLWATYSPIDINYQEAARGHGLSKLAQFLLGQGRQCTAFVTQQVDLTQSTDVILKDMRKIYKSNVKWGEKNLQWRLLDHESLQENDLEAFRQLHIEVAGKETRSLATWQCQENMIKQNEAFAMYAYLDEQLVSTGLFPFSDYSCYYGVGAYDRSFFHLPISHSLVMRAMQHAQDLGCQIFDFGESHYLGQRKGDGNVPTEKECSISHFKRGFGGQLIPCLQFS